MLFLFRSAPEVKKRINSKLFHKFWEEPGYKRANQHYCRSSMGKDESSDVRGPGPPNEGRAPNISAGPSTASLPWQWAVARLKLELIPACSYKVASRLNLGSQAASHKTNWSGQQQAIPTPCEQMGRPELMRTISALKWFPPGELQSG